MLLYEPIVLAYLFINLTHSLLTCCHDCKLLRQSVLSILYLFHFYLYRLTDNTFGTDKAPILISIRLPVP